MPKDLHLRVMQESDLEFFNRVRNDSREFLHDPSEYSLEENKSWFKKLTTPYLIAESHGQPIGYFRTSNLTEYSIYIGMDIALEFRGKGLAQEFYPVALRYLSDMLGIRVFYLEVLLSNTRAIHIYNKLGFVEIERLFEKNNTSIKMVLDYDKV